MKQLLVLLLTGFVCSTISCRKPLDKAEWGIRKAESSGNPIIRKYRPLIQEIILTDDTRKSMSLIIPGTTVKDSLPPLAAFKQLTQLNDKARQVPPRDDWHVLKIMNWSTTKKWALQIENPAIHPQVYLAKNRYIDSLLALQGSNYYVSPYNESAGTLFNLDLIESPEIYLLIKFTSIEPTYLADILFYPYNESKYRPISLAGKYGFLAALALFIILLLLYFLYSSNDILYPVFICYFIASILPWFFPFIYSDRSPTFYVFHLLYTVSSIFYFVLLIILCIGKYRWSKNLNILLLLASAYFIIQNGSSLLTINFGFYIPSLIHMLFQLCCLLVILQKNSIYVKDFVTKALLTLLIVQKLFSLLSNFELFDFLNGIVIFNTIAQILLFLLVVVRRFILFRHSQQAAKVQNVIAIQKEISGNVIKTLEEERNRISQDIHDELGGNLALLKIKIHGAGLDSEKLASLLNLVNRASGSARSIAYQLMPPYFSDTDFQMLLFEHFNILNEKGGMQFRFEFTEEQFQLPKADQLMLYRIIVELGQNCLKHSGASEVHVSLTIIDNVITLLCEDNGKGLPAQVNGGIGMKSIQARVAYLSGKLQIYSNQSGTKIEITIPQKN